MAETISMRFPARLTSMVASIVSMAASIVFRCTTVDFERRETSGHLSRSEAMAACAVEVSVADLEVDLPDMAAAGTWPGEGVD
jgi:hypothetical protein